MSTRTFDRERALAECWVPVDELQDLVLEMAPRLIAFGGEQAVVASPGERASADAEARTRARALVRRACTCADLHHLALGAEGWELIHEAARGLGDRIEALADWDLERLERLDEDWEELETRRRALLFGGPWSEGAGGTVVAGPEGVQ